MILRRYISALLIFYLFLLQVVAVCGHSHTASRANQHVGYELDNTNAEYSFCSSCFLATINSVAKTPEAFSMPAIYDAYSLIETGIMYEEIIFPYNTIYGGRAPPVLA